MDARFLSMMVAGAVCATAAQAEFNLQGKTVTLYIAGGAGGGVDNYARTVAPYIAKYLPGEPIMVSSNMPGGGGAQAVQYLYNVAAKDGTAIGTTNAGPINDAQLGKVKVNYDLNKFKWIGSLAKGNTICAAWHTSPFKTFEDTLKSEMTVSSTGATAAPSRVAWLMNKLAGTQLRPIAGYDGGSSLLAIERGEVDGTCTTLNALMSARPQWLRDKLIVPLFYVALEHDKGYEDVPLVIDHIHSDEDKRTLEFYLLPYEFNSPFMLPPGVSDEAVNEYRKAFDRAVASPEFLADAAKRGLAIKTENGARVTDYVERLLNTPRDIVEKTKAAVDPLQQPGKK